MSLRNIRAYWHVMRMSAREDRANPLRLASATALGIARMVLIAAIYKVAYEATQPQSLPYENALWSMGLYFAFIMGLGVRNIFKLVEQDVKTGAVEVGLIRPLDWRLTKLCQQIGKNTLEFALLIIAFAGTLAIVVGMPQTSYFTLPFLAGYALLIVLASISAYALFVTIGLTAFWLNDSTSVYRLIDRSIMVFGGAFLPIALLPDAIQTILRYSPFGIYGASTQLFNPGLAAHLTSTIYAGLFWTVALLLFSEWIWRRAERRIEVNGG